jgi:cyanophycin synthetase
MTFLRVEPLRGPNLWAYFPVMEAWVDLGIWKERPSDSIPGFTERLMRWLPGLIEHRCSVGERGGFLQRLREGTDLAHVLEHVALELQELAGVSAAFGRTRETSKEGVYKVVFKYREETLAGECLEDARQLCLAAAEARPFDMEGTLQRLRKTARDNLLPPSANAIVQAARRRNIPFLRLDQKNLVQFGYGARQRRIRAAETDRTGSIAGSIAEDKELTRQLLAAAGVPVVEGAGAGQRLFRLLVVGDRVVAADTDDPVHPDVEARAVDAASTVGLDIAGIDVMARDIQLPLETQGGGVISVIASPDLSAYLESGEEQAREVSDAIVDLLFPPGDDGRIPITAVTGTNGKTTVARFLAHILQGTGQCVAMTCTDGIYLNGRRISKGDCSGPASARQMLMSPSVEVAVFETARGGILRGGLAFNECAVAVVTNIGEGDHLGIRDMNTPEDMAQVKQTVVEVVGREGTAVLNAADPLVAAMAQRCAGRTLYFAIDETHPVMVEHRARGGRVVFVRGKTVVLAEGNDEEPLLDLDQVPMTLGGRNRFAVENALAGLGAACALGVPRAILIQRAESFEADLDQDPTRFNILEIRGATVIVDFGHNTGALRAVIQALESFPHERRAAVFSSSGDRRDEDILLMGELLGDAFDRVILYEDTDRYERPPGAILALLRQGLARGRRVRKVEEIEGGLNALRHGVETVEPGELLLAQAHLADPAVEYLRPLVAGRG